MSTTTKTAGKVKFFNATKGWGFIKLQNGKDVFFHSKNCVDRDFKPEADVEFTIEAGKKGEHATGVTLV